MNYLLKQVKKQSLGEAVCFSIISCVQERSLISLLSLLETTYSCFHLACAAFCGSHCSLSPSGISLVALVVPVSLGMYVNHKWPHKAKIILKVRVPCHSRQGQHTQVPQHVRRRDHRLSWFSHWIRKPLLRGLRQQTRTPLFWNALPCPHGKFLSTLWDSQFTPFKCHLLVFSTPYTHSTLFYLCYVGLYYKIYLDSCLGKQVMSFSSLCPYGQSSAWQLIDFIFI